MNKSEYERLVQLSDYGLDYTSLQDQLGDLTRLAAKVAGVKVSMVNLLDQHTQWTVARESFDCEQMPREDSVCQHTIQGPDPLMIEDLGQDERTRDKAYAQGDDALRFYYGVPLTDSNGVNLGALCVMSQQRCELSGQDRELIDQIAESVIMRLDLIRRQNQMRTEIRRMRETQRQVSHDLRGPIGGIIGLAELMEGQMAGKDAASAELIGMIRESGQSVLDLCDKVLGRSADAGAELRVCVGDFIGKLRGMYLPQARHKQVELTLETDDADEALPCDEGEMIQMAGNLVSNAIKYTPEGGRVDVRLLHRRTGRGRVLRVVVVDTGIGMSRERIERVMAMEVDSRQGTSGEIGYGIGLKLVQRMVQARSGRLHIDATEGGGCTVELEVPAVPDH